MKKLLIVCALMVGFTSAAQARILVEPYLGYEMGTTKNSNASDGKYEGSQLGLRLAYAAPVMFWAGIDGTFGTSGKSKPDVGPDEDAKRTTISGVVGIDLPILLRAWVGYGFSNEMKFDAGTAKGTNYKVGVGFTGLPFVSLNLEYVKDTYKEFDSFTLPENITNDSYVLSVSLPLKF